MKSLIVRWGVGALYAMGCQQPDVPIEMARQTALASVAGEVHSEYLDWEHGRVIYEFRIKPNDEPSGKVVKEVEVDANTGEVIQIEDEPLT
jgi:uncharacterized membrane protein YkoI